MFELDLLGSVQLRDEQGQVVPLRRHARAVLAILSLEPNGSRSRRSVAAMLWPNRDISSALTSLRQTLGQLKTHGVSAPILLSDKTMLRLDRASLRSDIEQIEGDDDPATLGPRLERCNSLLLDGIESAPAMAEWLEERRHGLRARLAGRLDPLLARRNGARTEAWQRLDAVWTRLRLAMAIKPPPPAATVAAVLPMPAPPRQMAAPPLLIVSAIRIARGADDMGAEEITEELLIRLARFKELRVTEEESGLAAERPAFRLIGSIHGGGETRRLIVRLLTIPDQEVIWADKIALGENMDGQLDRLTGRIACSMLLEDAPHLPGAVASAGPTYAQYIPHRMRALTPCSHAEALDAEMALRSLIRENPQFTFAYLALARLLNTDYGYTLASSSTARKRDEALALAQSALALDRAMSAAWLHVGFCLLRRREWEAAKIHIDQAMRLNGNDHTKLNVASTLYLYIGDLEMSETLLQRSLEFMREPSGDYMSDLGLLRLVQGRYQDAYDILLASPRPLLFTHVYLAVAAHLGGRESKAIVADCRQRLAPIFGGGYEPSAKAISDWIVSHHPFRDHHPRSLLRDGVLAAFAMDRAGAPASLADRRS